MTRRSSSIVALAATFLLLLSAAPRHARADSITRVRGKVTDTAGNPVPKADIQFEAVDVKKKLPLLKTNKVGAYNYSALDTSVARKWRVYPVMPGFKVVKVAYELIGQEGEEIEKKEIILSDKQEFPALQFGLVGDYGRNVIDFVVAKDAEFVAAVLNERRKQSGGTAAPAAAAPAAPAADAGKTAEVSLEKAKQLTDAGRHPEAIALYTAYLQKDATGNPAVYYYMGKSQFESGDDAAAEQSFRKGLELKSDMKGAHFFLGNVMMRGERYAEAAVEFEKEAELTTDSEAVFYNMGQAYIGAGQDDKALVALERATGVDPQKSEAYMLMADIYEKRKDKTNAEAMYQKVIAVDPKNAAVSFYNIGAHAWNENKAKEAVQAFTKSIEIDPRYAVAHRELARTLMGAGDFAGALKHFQEYLKLSPGAPDAREIQDNIALLKK